MSRLMSLALAMLLAVPATVQAEGADCDRQVEIVMAAVNARIAGDSIEDTRQVLREELDLTAGDMLADFIYGLPEEQLGDAVGAAYKAQCEAL